MHFSTVVLSGLLSAGLLNAAPVADKRADSSFTGLPSFTFTKPTGLPSFTFTKPTGLPSFTFTESFTKPTGSFSFIVPPFSSLAARAESPTESFTFTKPTESSHSKHLHHSFTGTFSKPTGSIVPPPHTSLTKRADSSFSFSIPPLPTESFTFTKPTGLPSFTFTETFSSHPHSSHSDHSFTGTFSKPTGSIVPPPYTSLTKRADSSFSFSVPPLPTESFTFSQQSHSSHSHHSFTGTFSKPTGTFSFTHPVPTSSAA